MPTDDSKMHDDASNGTPDPSTDELRVAIIGGGVVGVVLALGLIHQKISVRVYEQASEFREIGAGIAFSACARRCMHLVNPAIVSALKRCGAVPVSDEDGEDGEDGFLRWIDGYNQRCPDDPSYQKPLSEIGGAGFRGCRRDQFVNELAKNLHPGSVAFGKRLECLEKREEDGIVVMMFADGTKAEAHAVIGCDGVKSSVRANLLGASHPASQPQYTHKVAYRGLVSMSRALDVLGPWKAKNFHHHVGPGAHLTHYPVAEGKALNVVVFVSDPNPWPNTKSLVAEGTRDEIKAALAGWHPTVLELVGLLPDKLITWALFDMGEYPMAAYNDGTVCLAGDAAHASSPHHGAGASAGIEDALCLSILLAQVRQGLKAGTPAQRLVEVAFEVFDKVRRPRTQWLVNSSRRVCDLYHQAEWADPAKWIKAETCFEEIRDRSYKIWDFDIDDMVERTAGEVQRLHAQGTNGRAKTSMQRDGYVL